MQGMRNLRPGPTSFRMDLKIPPAVLVALAALGMWLGRRLVPAATLQLPALKVAAVLFAALGVTVAVLGLRSFRRAGTTVNPVAPQNASTLVRSGIYRISRNPMYLGFALLLAAWGLWLANLVSLLVLPAFVLYITHFQIVPEERVLEARFGHAYAEYRRQVRRWL